MDGTGPGFGQTNEFRTLKAAFGLAEEQSKHPLLNRSEERTGESAPG